MGELNRFLTEYCKLWKSIGYKLGLEDAVLDMIQSDCPTQRERFTAVLRTWLEQDSRPTWNSLELAITNARREELSLESIKESKIHIIFILFGNYYIAIIVPIQRVENEDTHKTREDNANSELS